ncbi:hypothetical protein [Streptomyces sp. NPDC005799]|uniref:hypothetical protein n=1 Tax=Streptomyces sp. NPDC005799 TaxID=3154678 RepID=UPI0033C82033
MRRRPLRALVVGLLLAVAALAGIWQWAAGRATPGGVSVAAATVGPGRAADICGDGYELTSHASSPATRRRAA